MSMPLICKVCLHSTILCPACQEKCDTGKISPAEVHTAHALAKFNKEITGQKIVFLDVIETKSRIVVVVDKGSSARIIGPGGRTVKKLSETLGKQLKIIEKSSDEKMLLENALGVPVKGVSHVFSPHGDYYKVRIAKQFERRVSKEALQLASELTGKKLQKVFE